MSQHIAWLPVLALMVGSVRLLGCEWACVDHLRI